MSNIFRISDGRKPRDKIASENKVVSLGFTVTIPYFSTLSHMYALVGYRFGLLGPVQTSSFTCAEFNCFFRRLK